MKSVLITFDQAYYERIMALLDRLGCRGFTYLEKVQGRGSKTGDPRDVEVDMTFAFDHGEVTHTAQQGIGDARRSA